MEYLIYDLIIVATLALFVWLGWRKGLLLSLCGLAVVIVSLLGAGFLADTLDTPVADAIQPKLAEVIDEQLTLHYDDQGVKTPLDTLREMGGLFAWAADAVEEAQDTAVGEAIGQLSLRAAQALATAIAYRVIFTIAFVLLFILLTLLLHALDLVAKLPGLHFCNGLGGGLIGLIKGGLILFVAITCLQLFSKRLTPQVVESTYLLKFFVHFSPISSFLQP